MRLCRTDVGGCLPKTPNFGLDPIDLRIRKGRKAGHGSGLPHPDVPGKNSIWKTMPGCSGLGACKSSDFFRVLMCTEEDFIIIVVEPEHPCI
jgi:hypothetical protein